MKKIIITEKQLTLLKILTESENKVKDYSARLNNITNQLNKAYTNINFISVAELLNGEADINPISNIVNGLDAQNSKISAEFENFFKSFDEDTYYNTWETIHNNLESVYYSNMKKITALLTIISDLGNLVYNNEDYKDAFSDIKSINLD